MFEFFVRPCMHTDRISPEQPRTRDSVVTIQSRYAICAWSVLLTNPYFNTFSLSTAGTSSTYSNFSKGRFPVVEWIPAWRQQPAVHLRVSSFLVRWPGQNILGEPICSPLLAAARQHSLKIGASQPNCRLSAIYIHQIFFPGESFMVIVTVQVHKQDLKQECISFGNSAWYPHRWLVSNYLDNWWRH